MEYEAAREVGRVSLSPSLSRLDRGVIAATDSELVIRRSRVGLTDRLVRLGFSSGTVAPGRAALNALSYLALRVAPPPPPPWRARQTNTSFFERKNSAGNETHVTKCAV